MAAPTIREAADVRGSKRVRVRVRARKSPALTVSPKRVHQLRLQTPQKALRVLLSDVPRSPPAQLGPECRSDHGPPRVGATPTPSIAPRVPDVHLGLTRWRPASRTLTSLAMTRSQCPSSSSTAIERLVLIARPRSRRPSARSHALATTHTGHLHQWCPHASSGTRRMKVADANARR